MNYQHTTHLSPNTGPAFPEGVRLFDIELNTVIDNLEQAVEALKNHSLIEEEAIVKSHLTRLRSPSFRQCYRQILKKRNLSPSAAVDCVVDELAATILS